MKNKVLEEENLKRIRKIAEEKILKDNYELDNLSNEVVQQIIHDLRVHQAELEIQNEELRQAQLKLAESEERYYDLYNLAPLGFITLNEKGLIIDANLATSKLLETDKQQLLNEPFFKFILENDQNIYFFYNTRLIETRNKQQFEIRFIKKEENFWANVEIGLIKSNDNSFRILMAFSDISLRKEYEKSLLERQHSFQFLYYDAPLPYQSLDEKGQILDVNKAWSDLFGYERKDVIGRSFRGFLIDEDSKLFKEMFIQLKKGEDIRHGFLMKHEKGNLVFISLEGKLIEDHNGNFVQAVCILQDISSKKNIENKVIRKKMNDFKSS